MEDKEFCPLIRSNCRRERCTWWSDSAGERAIGSIAYVLQEFLEECVPVVVYEGDKTEEPNDPPSH